MTEVFRTDIMNEWDAATVRNTILENFPDYLINFDLDDCDHILRIKTDGSVDADSIMKLAGQCGFFADILPDEIPAMTQKQFSTEVI